MISILIALTLGQCADSITDNYQTLCGQKAFTGLVDLQGELVMRGHAYSLAPGGGLFTASDYDLGWVFEGNRSASEPGAEFTIRSMQDRDAGFGIAIYRHDGQQTFAVDMNGKVLSGAGGFEGVGGSGATTISCSDGLYCFGVSRLHEGYWGHHGAWTFGNDRPMIAGFLFGLENVNSDGGNQTDKKFMINYQGGWETQANITSSTLLICDGHDVTPESDNSDRYTGVIPDGGHSWYVATDAGHAQDGCIFSWVVDVRSACQCDSTFYDGGLTSSWRKLHNGAECKP